jgi:hypothetical protein
MYVIRKLIFLKNGEMNPMDQNVLGGQSDFFEDILIFGSKCHLTYNIILKFTS